LNSKTESPNSGSEVSTKPHLTRALQRKCSDAQLMTFRKVFDRTAAIVGKLNAAMKQAAHLL
jgi:hypothetical protein